jgi:hypothetical protein
MDKIAFRGARQELRFVWLVTHELELSMLRDPSYSDEDVRAVQRVKNHIQTGVTHFEKKV